MKVTAIIPCYHKHFNLINIVLKCYLDSTYKPDQVIISLNGCKFINEQDIDNFENFYSNKFNDFLIIKTYNLLSRAKARNVCIKHIKNEIVCFSDADDIEHHQRFEIVKYFFEKKNIDHLLHTYILSKCYYKKCNNCFLCRNNHLSKFIDYDLENIDICNADLVNKINYPCETIKPNVKTVLAFHNNKQILPVHGLVCVRKNVLDNIKFNENYPRGQDSLFSQEVLKKYKNTIVINCHLHIYNNGWVPSEKEFIKFIYKDKDLYINMGSDNPPSPGTPRTNIEIDIIKKTILNLN